MLKLWHARCLDSSDSRKCLGSNVTHTCKYRIACFVACLDVAFQSFYLAYNRMLHLHVRMICYVRKRLFIHSMGYWTHHATYLACQGATTKKTPSQISLTTWEYENSPGRLLRIWQKNIFTRTWLSSLTSGHDNCWMGCSLFKRQSLFLPGLAGARVVLVASLLFIGGLLICYTPEN